MNIGSILSGGLGLISFFYPKAGPIISIIEKAAPYIEMALPAVQAAIEEGPGAFAAAKETAPQLTQAISDLVSHAKANGLDFGSTTEAAHENITRAIFGFGQMTPEQERDWMDKSTAWLSDSQAGSG